MKAILFGLRSVWREARSGELLVLGVALAIAVASVTAIGFLADRIKQAVEAQASEVLAADLRLRSTKPLNEDWLQLATAKGLRSARTLSFPSVVFRGDDSALATLKAVSDNYPLRGTVRISDKLLGPQRLADGIPAPGTVWADAALMARTGAEVGDTLELGGAKMTIAAVLTYRPDQAPGFSGFAPTLVLNVDDVDATGLISEGSRVFYFQLYAGAAADTAAFAEEIKTIKGDEVRIQDRGDAGSQLTEAIDKASRFLALASLISLLLAAVAVAMSARRFANRRLDTAALLKSLGAQQGFIVTASIVQLLAIGLLASVIGSLVGFYAERGLSTLLADLIGSDLPVATWTPVWLGAATALILLAGFALPSTTRLGNTPPMRVLRHDLAPPPLSAAVTYGVAMLALGAMIFWSVRDLRLLVVILGGTVATAALLFFVGRILVMALSRLRGRVGVAWRYGLANVARRGNDSSVQVVAFGLGIMVLLLLTLVRNDLLAGWRQGIDESAPNQFLINIQPEDRDGISGILTAGKLPAPEYVPLIRARMTHINDVPVGDIEFSNPDGRRWARREANLTYSARLSSSNVIVDGEFWDEDYDGEPLVSVDIDIAREMNLKLDDQLAFTVAGETLQARVSSMRQIEWGSFEPNFFMVFTPGALQEYPKTFVTSLLVPDERKPVLLTMVRSFPSVSVIDIEAILDQVRSVIDKAALAVQYVFFFTLAAGMVVLFAAVQSTLDERRYESALLRTFGASRRVVYAGIASEFAAIGVAAGFFAAIGATIVGSVAATQLFNLDYKFSPVLWAIGIAAGLVLVGCSGLVAARSAVNTPPVTTLRRA